MLNVVDEFFLFFLASILTMMYDVDACDWCFIYSDRIFFPIPLSIEVGDDFVHLSTWN